MGVCRQCHCGVLVAKRSRNGRHINALGYQAGGEGVTQIVRRQDARWAPLAIGPGAAHLCGAGELVQRVGLDVPRSAC